MRVVVISDTHGQHNKLVLPKCDCIIHCGDVTSRGYKQEVYEFLNWFEQLPFLYKIFIAGNHDWYFQETDQEEIDSALMNRGIIYLKDEGVEVNGIKIYGSPVTPWFFDWAFNVHRGAEIKKYWDDIPENLDILITHGPPKSILDKNDNSQECGCEDLLRSVLDKKPRFHLFGHIHEAYGKLLSPNTHFVNASVLNENYRLVNEPIVFDI